MRLDRLPYIVIEKIGDMTPHIRKQAEGSLYGQKNCSVTNMSTTCFAAEYCAACHGNGPRFPTADTFDAGALTTLVAVRRDVSENAYGDASCSRGDTFAGCVCIGPRSVYPDAMYPQEAHVPADATVLFTFCVDNTCRRMGVARALLKAARGRVSGPMYLFVSKVGMHSNNVNVASVMRGRVERLEKTYPGMGLVRCGETDTTVLFKIPSPLESSTRAREACTG